MGLAANEAYQRSGEVTLIMFAVRCAKAVERLHRERSAWQADSDIEALDEDHFVLVVRPSGGARRLAA